MIKAMQPTLHESVTAAFATITMEYYKYIQSSTKEIFSLQKLQFRPGWDHKINIQRCSRSLNIPLNAFG